MADVGTLSIQVEAEAQQATSSLNNLAGALRRVRNAVNKGIDLSGVTSQIRSLTAAINSGISDTTISRLNQLSSAISRLQRSSRGRQVLDQMIGGQQFAFGDLADQMENISGMAGAMARDMGSSFGSFGSVVDQARSSIDGLNDSLHETEALMQTKNWTNGWQQFADLFSKWSAIRSAFSLGPGTQTRGLPDMETGWTYWKEGAIEVEGTVSDAMDTIDTRIGNVNQRLLESGEATKEVVETVNEAQSATKGGWRMFDPKTGGFTKSLAEDLAARQQQAAEVQQTLGQTTAVASETQAAVQTVVDTANAASGAGMQSVADSMERVGAASDAIDGSGLQEVASGLQGIGSEAGNVSRVSSILAALGNAATRAGSAMSALRDSIRGIGTAISHSGIGNLVRSLGRVARYRMLRTVVREIASGIKEGFENYTAYSDKVGNKFSKQLKGLKSQFDTLKNSAGAAIAPALSAAIPVLQQIASAATAALNVVNQLISLLTGASSWTAAVSGGGGGGGFAPNGETKIETVTANVAANLKETTKQAKEAKKATKDLLADWDELNIIQSSGGGGGGNKATVLDDILNKFKEMEFDKTLKALVDSVNEQFGSALDLAKQIAAVLLTWKLSSALTGFLGQLATLAAVGLTINLVADLAATFDRTYMKTDEEGWLLADLLTTAVGSVIAGEAVKGILGTGSGLVTAGITFAFSAGATFAVAQDATGAQKEKLDLLALFKLALGSALAGFGMSAMGFSLPVSIVGGVIVATVAAAIKYEIDVTMQAKRKAEQAAKDAFSAAGEDGINPKDYIDKLQEQVDVYTAGHKVVINAYAEVPALKDTLHQAGVEIATFSAVLKGDGALTEEDAKAFKAAWDTILQTLDSMNKKNYDTILAGLNQAIANATGEIQANIIKLRNSFIQLEKNVDSQVASLYAEMGDIVDRIASGNYSQADIDRYSKIYQAIADATNESMKSLDRAIQQGRNLDFGNAEEGVKNALEYLENVHEISKEAMKTIDQSLQDSVSAVEDKKARLKSFYENGLLDLTKEEYDAAMSAYDQIIQALQDSANKDKTAVQDRINQAYELAFKTAMAGDNGTPEYWENIVKPLVEKAKESGAEIPKAFVESMQAHLQDELIETPTDSAYLGKNIFSQFVDQSPEGIAKQINDELFNSFKRGGSLLGWENNAPEMTMLDVSKLFGLQGFDILTDNMKKGYANAIRDFWGESKGNKILEALGYDFGIDQVDIPTWFVPKAENPTAEMVQDAKDEADQAVDRMGLDKEPVKPIIDVEPKINADTSVLDGDAKKIADSIQNAIIQGLSKDSVQALMNQKLEEYGFVAYGEALPAIQEMWKKAFPEGMTYEQGAQELGMGDVDASGVTKVLDETAVTAKQRQAEIDETIEAIGGTTGEVNGSPMLASLGSLSSQVWAYVSSILSALSQLGSAGTGGMGIGAFKMPTLKMGFPGFASGGFPDSGNLFMADENGNIELKGKMGSQPVVANNQQIIEGISKGVSEANGDVVEALQLLANEFRSQAGRRVIVTPSSAMGRTNARSSAMYERVRG